MRSLSNRTSPTGTNYNTPKRSRTPEDSPRDAPANPAIADDRNAPENLSATRTDQTEAQEESLTGGGEPFQSASSVPATGTNPTDALPVGQGLPLDRDQFYRLLADQQVDPLILSDLPNLIAAVPGAPRTGQTQAQHEDATPNPQSNSLSPLSDPERHLLAFLESERRDLAATQPQPAAPIAAALDRRPQMAYGAVRDQAFRQNQAVAQQRTPDVMHLHVISSVAMERENRLVVMSQ